MGLEFQEVAFAADRPPEQQPVRMKRRLMNDVKKELLPLYRHRPAIVDSLFEEYVAPKIRSDRAPTQSNFDDEVDRHTERAYQVLRQYFTEPRTRGTLGDDVPIVYPDSLRSKGTGGRVEMQVYMNAEGEPLGIETIEGVHPVLDDIARRAATQMRWEAAQLEGTPISCWVRYSIQFTP
jgi:TonB family protein